VRKILFIFGLWLGVAFYAAAAETLTLTDGSSVTGDIVKYDDNGMMLRDASDAYVTLPWAKFSQDALKQLVKNPKIKPFVEVFIEPDQSQRPPKPEIKVNEVTRLERPAHPSIIGGLVTSSLGWFILLLVYAANLYAAFEVSVIRARPAAQVMGLAAVLPIIGPIIFLLMPIKIEAPPEEEVVVAEAAPTIAKLPSSAAAAEEAAKPEDTRPQPQIFARGKFTFNKRFVETKFAGYIGEPKGDALKFAMELKSPQGSFHVVRIVQVAATDVTIETVERGPVTVPLADILEVKLNPKVA
jgi:hypothetical protein